MFIEIWKEKDFSSNSYLVVCENNKEALLVDPGKNGPEILQFLDLNGYKLLYIVNTHGHIDHIWTNDIVKSSTGAKLLIHNDDKEMLLNPNLNLSAYFGNPIIFSEPDKLISDKDEILLGDLVFEVLHVPGHTPGGICLKLEDGEKRIIFSGDTLFESGIGRTDFEGGSLQKLISSIKDVLFKLEDDTVVYPGHGPSTSIGKEKVSNPFLEGY